jgi:hypothetical protein
VTNYLLIFHAWFNIAGSNSDYTTTMIIE